MRFGNVYQTDTYELFGKAGNAGALACKRPLGRLQRGGHSS